MTTRSLLKLSWLPALFCLLAVAVPLHTNAAAGTTTVDQEQLTFNGALTVRSGTSQTLTVGISGMLTRIDLPFCTVAAGNQIVLELLTIQGQSTGAKKMPLIFTTNDYKCNWYSFTIPTPLSVTSGQVIKLLVTRVKGFAPLWGADRLPGDPYPRGIGKWMGHAINDFAFRTWVTST